jgi:hypothetical protein
VRAGLLAVIPIRGWIDRWLLALATIRLASTMKPSPADETSPDARAHEMLEPAPEHVAVAEPQPEKTLLRANIFWSQRWHAAAVGLSAQIGESAFSRIRYRVTAKSTRRMAMTNQISSRDIRS